MCPGGLTLLLLLPLTSSYSSIHPDLFIQARQFIIFEALRYYSGSSTIAKKKKETKMASVRENLLQTAKAYIEGFNSGTPEGIVVARTADCTQTLRPGSLPPPLTGSRTNEEYMNFIVQGAQILRNIKLRLAEGEDIIVDDVARKIVMHLKSTGESDFGPYANEYMIVLKATEDGKQIKEIVEFTDSAYFLSLAAKMAPPA